MFKAGEKKQNKVLMQNCFDIFLLKKGIKNWNDIWQKQCAQEGDMLVSISL